MEIITGSPAAADAVVVVTSSPSPGQQRHPSRILWLQRCGYGGGGSLAILLLLGTCCYLAADMMTTTTMPTTQKLLSLNNIPSMRNGVVMDPDNDHHHHRQPSSRSLVCFFSWCTGPTDDCPKDPKKTKPGKCGCGVSDYDTDGDGTPDCSDLCPYDKAKISPGVCGCGNADGDTDRNGILDCFETCASNQQLPTECTAYVNAGYTCRGCAQQWMTVTRDCGYFYSTRTSYSLQYMFTRTYEYNAANKTYCPIFTTKTAIQRGTNSSDSSWERINDCNYFPSSSSPPQGLCTERPNVYNDRQCIYLNDYACLQCNPDFYCLYRVASTTPPSNPFFFLGNDETLRFLGTCDPLKLNPLLDP